jgi:hypothetical protein
MLLSKGNDKVKALIFDLPTSSCGISCNKCYAKKAEIRFPNVMKKRNYNLGESRMPEFVSNINSEIVHSKNKTVRIHSSGDFYSQDYLNKWKIVAHARRDTKFYTYTKKKQELDFTAIEALPNVNIINSVTPLGVNYGDSAYCKELVDIGYFLCPCNKENKIKCQVECNHCSIKGNDKVCFLIH